jgi:hypothetical protein
MYYPDICLGGLRKTTKIAVRITYLGAQIWIQQYQSLGCDVRHTTIKSIHLLTSELHNIIHFHKFYHSTAKSKYIKNSLLAICILSAENAAAYKFPCHLALASGPALLQISLFSHTLCSFIKNANPLQVTHPYTALQHLTPQHNYVLLSTKNTSHTITLFFLSNHTKFSHCHQHTMKYLLPQYALEVFKYPKVVIIM